MCRSLRSRSRRWTSWSVLFRAATNRRCRSPKWLAARTDILIIDEPTVGIDIKTKVELHELIGELARQGVAVLLISSDMAEMITLADRILVMHDFAIESEVVNDHVYETTSKAIMAAIHAVEPPDQSDKINS